MKKDTTRLKQLSRVNPSETNEVSRTLGLQGGQTAQNTRANPALPVNTLRVAHNATHTTHIATTSRNASRDPSPPFLALLPNGQLTLEYPQDPGLGISQNGHITRPKVTRTLIKVKHFMRPLWDSDHQELHGASSPTLRWNLRSVSERRGYGESPLESPSVIRPDSSGGSPVVYKTPMYRPVVLRLSICGTLICT